MLEKQEPDLTPEDHALVDQAAELGCDASWRFRELRALYDSEPALRVPAVIRNWSQGRLEAVTL